ncbi:MAG TPA: RluA family pseudouridine synthase [Candidatus Saccharibacteria bacterium]|nr:RluA family pseudouridine synthase [Candidatus Saccharibacteria bacterium]HMR38719.1 RluA family pseudouridine synthase [Candidatus Saccharibacteria bacterium]
MKIHTSDVFSVLKKFQIASSDHTQKDIDQLIVKHPSPINTGAKFRFLKKQFLLLFDETAEDDEQYIENELKKLEPNLYGELLANPTTDIATHGLPYKGKHCYLFRQDNQKVRLDQYLSQHHPQWSRSSWQKLIKNGKVTVDDKQVLSPSYEIAPESIVAFEEPSVHDTENKAFPILEKNDHIIAMNKPVGTLTHRKNELNDEFTVADFFRNYTTAELDTDRPGIVHRLDRDTSGVIVGARDQAAFDLLKKAFAGRTVTKTYYAITDGIPSQSHFVIDLPILRNSNKPGSFMVHPSGKPAITTVKVLATKDNLSLLQLTPKTGRTHQLRVHLAYIGTPIHGDRLYGTPAERMYLHAYSLEFPTLDGKRQTVVAELPEEFNDIVPSHE